MESHLTRRQALGAAGIGLAGAATLGVGWKGLAAGLEQRKNIVLVVIDTLRPDHLGCYGSDVVRSPNIDAFCRDSLRFTRAYPEAMPTGPARRSIMTGRRVFPFRDWQPWKGLGKTPGWAPIMPGTPTLATELGAAGYWTGCVTDNPFLGYAKAFLPFRQSFDRFASITGQVNGNVRTAGIPRAAALANLPEYMRDPAHVAEMRRYLAANGGGGHDIVEAETAAARVFEGGSWMLKKALSGRPFFLMVDSFDPHEPWAIPRRYLDLYGDPDYPGLGIGDIAYGSSDLLVDGELDQLRATYAGGVTLADHWFGKFLDELEYLRLAENTIVLLVSDHGIHLGERGWIGKSAWFLTGELTHVPFMIREPDRRGAGMSSDWFASTHDVAPTLMSLAGAGASEHFTGADLSPVFEGGVPDEEREIAYGGYSNHFFARTDRWAMVSNNRKGGGDQLYDISVDPREQNDVSEQHKDVVEDLYDRVAHDIGHRPPWYGPATLELPPRSLPKR